MTIFDKFAILNFIKMIGVEKINRQAFVICKITDKFQEIYATSLLHLHNKTVCFHLW